MLIHVIVFLTKLVLIPQGLPDTASMPRQEQAEFGVLRLAAAHSFGFCDTCSTITILVLAEDKPSTSGKISSAFEFTWRLLIFKLLALKARLCSKTSSALIDGIKPPLLLLSSGLQKGIDLCILVRVRSAC